MTNQEAIKRIKEHIAIHKYRESHAIHIVEALEMAISALQAQDLQPTCNNLATDTISRQAAIELAMQYCPDDDGSCSKADRDIRELLDDLENLPSAQPESEYTMEEFMYGQDLGSPEDGSL